jgi:hypothetical protein
MLFLRANQEGVMAFEPGDVVFLKSGGSPMTVAAVDEDADDDDDTEDAEHEDTDSEEADEDEARPAKNKRKAV